MVARTGWDPRNREVVAKVIRDPEHEREPEKR
jgi:hypothetical protein